MGKINVKEILAYCEAAIPGPWDYKHIYYKATVNDGSHKDWTAPEDIPVNQCTMCGKDGEYVRTLTEPDGNYHAHRYLSVDYIYPTDYRTVYSATAGEEVINNAKDIEFAARARTDLPALCKRVIELEKALQELMNSITDDCFDSCHQTKEYKNAEQILE